MKTALLISTYKQPKTLALILKTVQNQTVLPNEILIADDGSGIETKSVIESFKKQVEIPLVHQWHEDKGFRKSTIINKTIAKSNADYIIQVDGDCLLHSNFIKDHINNSKPNLYLYGTRVHVKEKYVKNIVNKETTSFSFFGKGLKKRFRGLYFPLLNKLFNVQEVISHKFRGCNTSFWKKDFIAINGYNEDFQGWGREDSELMIRLHNSGIKAKRLKFNGIVYHLDHPEKDTSNFKTNDYIQNQTIKKKLTYIPNGIDKYL